MERAQRPGLLHGDTRPSGAESRVTPGNKRALPVYTLRFHHDRELPRLTT